MLLFVHSLVCKAECSAVYLHFCVSCVGLIWIHTKLLALFLLMRKGELQRFHSDSKPPLGHKTLAF